MTGTAGSVHIRDGGFAGLPASVDLAPSASGAWVDTGLQVVLPAAGTYDLDATVRVAMRAVSPVNAFTVARLFDATASVVVPGSEVMVLQVNTGSGAVQISQGLNQSAPIQIRYTVSAPTTVRVEVARTNSQGTAATVAVISDAQGRTTLRFERVA